MTGVPVTVAARQLGVSAGTCRDWYDRGYVAGFRTAGGHRRVYVAELTEDQYISVSEAARLLGVSADVIRHRFDAGRLAGTRSPAGQRRIARSGLTRLARAIRPKDSGLAGGPAFPVQGPQAV